MLRGLVLAALLVVGAQAQAPATAAGSSATKKTSSPFSAFTKSLAQEKKKPFMDLMKRLRSAKAASVGTKEEKKKATGALDSEIHKLLGPEYKRYRAVQQTAKEAHMAKKAPPGSTTVKAAPPPPVKSASPTKKKKVMSSLPTGQKKVRSSTTVG